MNGVSVSLLRFNVYFHLPWISNSDTPNGLGRGPGDRRHLLESDIGCYHIGLEECCIDQVWEPSNRAALALRV